MGMGNIAASRQKVYALGLGKCYFLQLSWNVYDFLVCSVRHGSGFAVTGVQTTYAAWALAPWAEPTGVFTCPVALRPPLEETQIQRGYARWPWQGKVAHLLPAPLWQWNWQ